MIDSCRKKAAFDDNYHMGLFGWKKTKEEKEAPRKQPSTAKAPARKDDGKNDDAAGKASMKDLYAAKPETPAGGKTEAGETAAAGKNTAGRKRGHAYRLILKPLVTEKAANLSAENKYVFAVAPGANKIEIAGAVEEAYGIRPESVNIIRVRGKKVRHGRVRGRRKDWKKAIVTLPAGRTINIYEGV